MQVVDIDATSEPDSGSVSPHAPTDVPSISGGKNFDFCSSFPNLAILCKTNPIWDPYIAEVAPQALAISSVTIENSLNTPPDPPYF